MTRSPEYLATFNAAITGLCAGMVMISDDALAQIIAAADVLASAAHPEQDHVPDAEIMTPPLTLDQELAAIEAEIEGCSACRDKAYCRRTGGCEIPF